MCPPAEDQPLNCRTCCCKASDNVDFFHPNSTAEPKCTATDIADYKVSLIPSITNACHAGYPFVGGVGEAYFSDFIVASHLVFQDFDSCGDNVIDEARDYLEGTEETLQSLRDSLDRDVEDNVVYDYYLGSNVLERQKSKRRSTRINLSPSVHYLSLVSKLVSI